MDGSIERFVLLEDLDEECKAFSQDLLDAGAFPLLRGEGDLSCRHGLFTSPFVKGVKQAVLVAESSVEGGDGRVGQSGDVRDVHIFEGFFGEKAFRSVKKPFQALLSASLPGGADPFKACRFGRLGHKAESGFGLRIPGFVLACQRIGLIPGQFRRSCLEGVGRAGAPEKPSALLQL